MSKRKILYTATVLSHICQFHLPYLQELQAYGYETHVAARDNLSEKNGLRLQYADRFIPIPFQRSPKSLENIKAYRQLRSLIRQENYDLIVCNTPVGGIVTRLAARGARHNGTRVVYVAHGFHFYHGAPLKNWLVFYPIERIMSRLTDLIVTITQEDFSLAQEKFYCPAAHIHGIGVSSQRYHPVTEEARRTLREAECLAPNDFVILCTGELNRNKDQETLLQAAALMKGQAPNLKILLAGNGPLEGQLKSLSNALELDSIVRFLGYRTDLERVVPIVDTVVSCSRREGLPLNVVEAMLCGQPVIAAENRGTRELIQNGKTGFLFCAGDPAALAHYISILQSSTVRSTISKQAFSAVTPYTVEQVRNDLLPLLQR